MASGSLLVPRQTDREWVVEEPGFDPVRNRHVEAIMALGTGFLSVRSSLEERLSQDDQSVEYDRRMDNVTLERIPSTTSKWGTYLPAIQADHPNLGRGIVNLPYLLGLELSAEGIRLSAEDARVSSQARRLDLLTATGYRYLNWKPAPGVELLVQFRRFLPLGLRFAVVQECSITALRGEADLEASAFLDTDVRTNGFDVLRERLLDATGELFSVLVATNAGSRIAAASRLSVDGKPCRQIESSARAAGTRHRLRLKEGQACLLRKDTFLAADPYYPGDVLAAAVSEAQKLAAQDVGRLHAEHCEAWRALWRDADVRVESGAEEQVANQIAVRLAAYHLLRAKAAGDTLGSVDAKGVTGDAYFGSVFWDMDIFDLPFYLYACPAKALAHVGFRARNLPAARERARRDGYPGARYPWQSAADGRETCVPWQYADHEVHITADVALGIWHYVAATGDLSFMARLGIDVLVETARYWMGRVEPVPDSYRILGVMGPDEYKPLVNDNAYTNFCVRFALGRTVEALELLEAGGSYEAACARLGLEPAEIERFRDVAARLRVPRDEGRGIVWQCEGFETEFSDPDFSSIWKDRTELFGRVVSQEKRYRMKCLKQGDVVALFALFPNAFDRRTMSASLDYYLPFTTHDSSLSWTQHALVAARLGRADLAYECWQRCRRIDMGADATASDGVHIANAGGLWQAMVFGFAGMDTALEQERFTLHPSLPAEIRSVAFRAQWKGRSVSVSVAHDRVVVQNESDQPLPVRVAEEEKTLAAAERTAFTVT